MKKSADEKYSVGEIVECLEPQISQTQHLREQYFTWARNPHTVLQHYAKEKIEPVLAHLKVIDAKHPTDKKAAEEEKKSYLATQDIYYQTGTAEQAVELERQAQFFNKEVVVDPEKDIRLQRFTFARYLESIDVFSSVFTSSKKAAQKPADTLFMGVRGFLSSLLRAFC